MPQITVNGVSHYYELTGPSRAPVIAFSHSIGTSLHLWDAQVAAFAGRYRCLRYDTRGHGRSEVRDAPATADDLADDLAGLLDALGIERASVVGLSLGGMVGQAFALRHPNRLDRLALLATSAEMPRPFWLERVASVRADGLAPLADITMVPRWFTAAYAAVRPDVVGGFRERFLKTDRAGYSVAAAVIAELDLLDRIHAIRAPTLIMVGADDPATPVAMAETIRSRIPHAEMVVVPAASHLVAVEQAEIVNGYLAAFLERGLRATAPRTGGTSFEDGVHNRRTVLGAEHVDRTLAQAGDFGAQYQDFISRAAWGDIWGDPALPWKTRSMLTLAMMVALHREEEFKLHLRPALGNGVTLPELRALLLQTAIYGGVPAANAGMRWVREVLGDELNPGGPGKT